MLKEPGPVFRVKLYEDDPRFLPKRATEGAAGWDIRAREEGTIDPGQRVLVPAGFSLQMHRGWECQVRPRSGLALRNGIMVLNSPGTIDADYRGEVGVILLNTSLQGFRYGVGDRIAQIVFSRVWDVVLKTTESLEQSTRGSGGFGSTGKT